MDINTGDTAWVLASAALVLFMTPGLALFYGGMVRAKNVLAMLMQNFFAMGIVSVLWVVVRLLARLRRHRQRRVHRQLRLRRAARTSTSDGVSGYRSRRCSFVAFQLMFAVITPALITGAIADRMRFAAWVGFIGALVDPRVHRRSRTGCFAGGWLAERGALDFAGGTVVHINAGAARARAGARPRQAARAGRSDPMPPHSLPLTLLGTGILWFGWFGFNAGSALAANGVAAQAFINTFVAAAAAMLGWLVVERIKGGHATTLGAASGAVAGLVAITPCAGFVGGDGRRSSSARSPGVVCYLAIS